MSSDQEQSKQVNFSHLIALFIGIAIPVIIWGVGVSSRLAEMDVKNDTNRKAIEKMEAKSDNVSAALSIKIDQINNKLTDILIELQNKKNR